MKKNISINISGIIFHIEEDGYDQLKAYLESINRYFSTFDDSLEIIADIETRIAELFLAKLKEGQQVIGLGDVEELIATMGSIKDFQAAEEETSYTSPKEEEPEDEKAEEGEPLFSKKLYRDNNRKLLAGVLSGLAYYFNIDPLWMRLLYVLLFFGVSILPSIAGFLFIGYIVMWIVVPASDELKEEKKIKKMYRDPDGKVLGGVSSGIAAYFGVDVVIIRLLFFASIFIAGTGLILYIILWIILPEAKTLTDKMEMQGQPVTLSNIESNIKKSLKVEGGEENILVKILLFPFRLIAALFEFLSRALGPFMSFLVEAVRVVFGVILAILGISGVLAVLIAGGVMIGLFAGGDMNRHVPDTF
jgi:phage shock protein PspC (stress-responsive transcriptional regulator)